MIEEENIIIEEISPAGESESQIEEEQTMVKKPNKIFLVGAAVLIVILGITFGWFLSSRKASLLPQLKEGEVAQGDVKKGQTFGRKDTKNFPDSVVGVVKEGGIDGEGTHHLERIGGPSQTVYLTSSVLSLKQFVDREVKIWGETFAAQKAGWLMDVGKLEVLK